ncbi:MAG: formate/nitrite transporter family protein [Gemmatimonadales bacterium]|jgi:formate/nitrite transporter FocA (FNT family)
MTDSDRDSAREAQKAYGDILDAEIERGLRQLRRDAGGLIVSGLSAGLDIGFSLFLMATMLTAVGREFSPGLVRILLANMYAVGFIFVVLGRSELFTEHTTLAVFAVLSGDASVASLGRLWGLVYLSNIVGAAAFAALAVVIGPALGSIDPRAFGEIARDLVEHAWWIIFLSGLLAGWMMGLLSWLLSAARDTISQVFVVFLVTAAIGFGHLHHSIVGTVEVLAGVFSRQGVALIQYSHFILWATVGNALGGVIFVALIKYSHVRGKPQLGPREQIGK